MRLLQFLFGMDPIYEFKHMDDARDTYDDHGNAIHINDIHRYRFYYFTDADIKRWEYDNFGWTKISLIDKLDDDRLDEIVHYIHFVASIRNKKDYDEYARCDDIPNDARGVLWDTQEKRFMSVTEAFG